MKNLLIIGAGGFGREMFATAREAIGYGEELQGRAKGNAHAACCTGRATVNGISRGF